MFLALIVFTYFAYQSLQMVASQIVDDRIVGLKLQLQEKFKEFWLIILINVVNSYVGSSNLDMDKEAGWFCRRNQSYKKEYIRQLYH